MKRGTLDFYKINRMINLTTSIFPIVGRPSGGVLTNYHSSENQSSEQLIEEVMRRLLERADRVDVAWENGPGGWYIARGNAVRVLLGFDLPDDAQALIEARCKDSEFTKVTRVIVHGKRRVILLFPPLRHTI
jgi:hypothetical protein